MSLSESLSDLEKEILAKGEKLRALAREEVLKIRQSKLVEELKKIEEELAALVAPARKTAPKAEKPAEAEPEKS